MESSTLGHVDLIGFDACLMPTTEVAYGMRNVASFMVGSEKAELAFGWPYDYWCVDLIADPNMTAAQLAQTVVQQYGE